jgi:hypothetical protein
MGRVDVTGEGDIGLAGHDHRNALCLEQALQLEPDGQGHRLLAEGRPAAERIGDAPIQAAAMARVDRDHDGPGVRLVHRARRAGCRDNLADVARTWDRRSR